MKLTNYIKDLGKVIAFYPALKKITHSTTASILLCQFLYWTDKAKDGWIYKTHSEIEEETGLTYYEQKTARKALVDIGILEEKFMRWDRTNKYRINQKKLNACWENLHLGSVEPAELEKEPDEIVQLSFDSVDTAEDVLINEETVAPAIEKTPIKMPILNNKPTTADKADTIKKGDTRANRTDAVKKGDLMDGFLKYADSPGIRKENAKNRIREEIETGLNIIASDKRWEKFIEFAYIRQEKYKEYISTFIGWALREGFNPLYWTPEKCTTMYPQAFRKDQGGTIREDFVEKLPERREKENVPMPDDLKTKRKLY